MAAILLAAAALKAADRTGTTVALAAFGIPGRLAAPVWAALIVVEAALAAGIAAGSPTAAYAAGLVLAGFLLVQVDRARAGERGRAVRLLRARRAALHAAPPRGPRCWRSRPRRCPRSARRAGAAARRPPPRPPPPSWCSRSGAGTRAAGRARARRRGAAARPGQPARRLVRRRRGELALALFTSPGCWLCRKVAPAADALGRPCWCGRFDEGADARGVGRRARARARRSRSRSGADGAVLAKGTVNDRRQLASVLAAASASAGAA